MEIFTDTIEDLTGIFKVLSDPTRLRLAALLSIRGETCVCHLAQSLEEPEYKTSRHLAVMKAAGMVRARRDGTWMHYRLVDADAPLTACLYKCLRNQIRDYPVMQEILARAETISCE